MSKIAVIGTGYVGLTTGACFAHLGHTVVCADVDAAKLERLRRAELPILEEGLEDLVVAGVGSGRLRFVLGAAAALSGAEFVFLCLPTPQGGDGAADLSYVLSASAEIGELVEPGAVVVTKSTVPVGTAARVAAALGRDDVAVASNPEFLREGTAVADFLHPDRIVVGSDTAGAAARVAELYAGLPGERVLTGAASSETIKYAANSFLATKVAFANSIAHLCEHVGADAGEVLHGMGLDDRIGARFLTPGPGYGGSCFGKDTRALVAIGREAGVELPIVSATITSNEDQMLRMADKAERLVGRPVGGMRIAVWGLTFKAGTDDLRDSPALRIIDVLRSRSAHVAAYDPAIGGRSVDRRLDGIELCADAYSACRGASLLIVATEWAEFADADLVKVAECLSHPRVLDTRNLLDVGSAAAAGLHLVGVGR
jgi:UDPglucose 6-dehydrogenase